MDTNSYLQAEENVAMLNLFEKLGEIGQTREVVFLCVGSNKFWYDRFGPMFGSLMQYLRVEKFVYGNLNCCVTAKNIEDYIYIIKRFHANPYIIVVDNAVSSQGGGLKAGEGPVTCSAFNENAVSIGDMHILYTLSPGEISCPDNYLKMVRELKRVGRLMYFSLKNAK